MLLSQKTNIIFSCEGSQTDCCCPGMTAVAWSSDSYSSHKPGRPYQAAASVGMADVVTHHVGEWVLGPQKLHSA